MHSSDLYRQHRPPTWPSRLPASCQAAKMLRATFCQHDNARANPIAPRGGRTVSWMPTAGSPRRSAGRAATPLASRSFTGKELSGCDRQRKRDTHFPGGQRFAGQGFGRLRQETWDHWLPLDHRGRPHLLHRPQLHN